MILRLIWFTHRANPTGKRGCGVVVAAVDEVVAKAAIEHVVTVQRLRQGLVISRQNDAVALDEVAAVDHVAAAVAGELVVAKPPSM
jgi:hypothetical protein